MAAHPSPGPVPGVPRKIRRPFRRSPLSMVQLAGQRLQPVAHATGNNHRCHTPRPHPEVPIPPVTAGASLSGSGVISESDVGSLGSSSIDVPSPIPGATGAISGPSTDSSSERSITRIGYLSGTISLREYKDDDDGVVLLGSSTRMPSLVSNAVGKFERIKTHQCSFYAPNLKEHVMQKWGSIDKVRIPKTKPSEISFGISWSNTSQTTYERSITNNRTPISLVKTGYRLLGHLPGLSWDQPQFRAPPDSLLGVRTPPQSMMRCPRRPVGPHPPRSTPLFKWIHS
ncbi:hypothetical protein M9H77_30547 [Catharanthus roseus]|uniref:Uncharacterized protein n=1 Tax=Catharanthus roseus TaxID=4058 RepID=A0ACB9ZZE7_CATRO|nr:hypothetical protein M9H77_30547 [Catharanthus roseus]